MQLVFDSIVPVRARRSDPSTSQRAAVNAATFANSHSGRILHALRLHGQRTTHEIAQITGLTVVQVDRRKKELERAGLIRVVSEVGKFSTLEALTS